MSVPRDVPKPSSAATTGSLVIVTENNAVRDLPKADGFGTRLRPNTGQYRKPLDTPPSGRDIAIRIPAER